jgi:hypothetical protein
LNALWQAAVQGRGNFFALGIYLHYLQDTFSHKGYTNSTYGHATGNHSVDKTDDDVPKAQSMVAATWKTLNDFAKEKLCGCQGKWTGDMWATINPFLNAPGGGPYDRRVHAIDEIDPKYINNKIRLLGVPHR